ncbi:MAG: glutamate--tRNA ligase [Atopobiaceae bacterium]|nr:glutamate--tRNA ligase [Atopobiaceae bacterium]
MSDTNTNAAVRVRFAPSPTGKLHVGGARTAIYNWAFARANGGTFVLRIDDTDPTRSTEENTQIILRAMRWLGLDWDEGPEVGGQFGPYFQTERMDIYREAAERLVAEGHAYYCFCSPEQLAADREAAKERGDSFQGYQRTCRGIDPEVAQARVAAGEPHTIRIKVPEDRGDVVVRDAVHGEVVFNARELDDFIIFRSDGTPTYNFATVVDDAEMGITHIIRGDDHLSNTPRQVIVYEALGAPTPIFAHISMILGSDGKKLSKRHGATSVEEYRDAGYLSDAFVNYLALLGWAPDGESTVISRERLAREFSLDHVSKNPAIMDPKKLDFINAEYLHAMDDAGFAHDVLLPQLNAAGLDDGTQHDESWYLMASAAFKPRCTLSSDVVAQARYLYTPDDELVYDEKATKRWLAKQGARAALEAASEALAKLDEASWGPAAIEEALEPLPEQLGMGKGKVFQPIRVACVGGAASPGIGETLALLARAHTLARIERAKELAQ